MDKISSEKKAQVYVDAADALRKLAAERDFYKGEHEKLALRSHSEKLASAMIEKGLETGDVRTLADRIEKQASTGQLDLRRVEDAVSIVGPNILGKTASVSDERVLGAASDLETFVMS